MLRIGVAHVRLKHLWCIRLRILCNEDHLKPLAIASKQLFDTPHLGQRGWRYIIALRESEEHCDDATPKILQSALPVCLVWQRKVAGWRGALQ